MPIKNTNDIRSVITEEIEAIKDGTSTPSRANAISNLIGKLIASVKLDIEYSRNLGDGKDLNTPVVIDQKEKPAKKLTPAHKKRSTKGVCKHCSEDFLLNPDQHPELHWCPKCRGKYPLAYKKFLQECGLE